MSPGDMFRGIKAESQGETLVVKLPIVQLILIAASAALVLAGVWLTTRDLGSEVHRLSITIDKLSVAIDRIHDRIDDHEIRLRLIERDNERSEAP